MRLTVVNLKGGAAKTTSAVFLAHELATSSRVLLVDADPQASALAWSEAATAAGESFGFDTIGLPVRDLHRRLDRLTDPFDHVVIDTPPADAATVRSALLTADVGLLPLSPSTMELSRLHPTLDLVAEVDSMRPSPLQLRLLLTRVRRPATRNARLARTALLEQGLPLLDAEIPILDRIATAYGTGADGAELYGPVLAELSARAA